MKTLRFHSPLLILTVCCIFFLPFCVSAQTPMKARVAYRDMGAYATSQHGSSFRGLLVDYMQKVAQAGDINLEPVFCDNWSECLKMLQTGKIDLLPGLAYTPERAQHVNFSSLPMGVSHMTIIVRQEDPRWNFGDYASFQGMRLGYVAGARSEDMLDYLRRRHGVAVDARPFSSTAAMMAALQNGLADGAITPNLGKLEPFRIVAQFAPESYYIGIAPGKTQLLERINKTLADIAREESGFSISLFDKYFSSGIRFEETHGVFNPFNLPSARLKAFLAPDHNSFAPGRVPHGDNVVMTDEGGLRLPGGASTLQFYPETDSLAQRKTLFLLEMSRSDLYIVPLPPFAESLRATSAQQGAPVQFPPQIGGMGFPSPMQGQEGWEGSFSRTQALPNPVGAVTPLTAVLGGMAVILAFALGILLIKTRRMEAALNKDALTDMPNLEKFKKNCAFLLSACQETDYVLLTGDICQFKTVNDQFGFAVGDHLLRAFGTVMQQNITADECCARISSDLFVLLLRYSTWDQMTGRIRQMEEPLDAWRRRQGLPYRINTAFGAYHIRRPDTRDVQLMLDLANYARLEAKRTPNTPVVLYDEHMRQETLLHQELTGRLEDALAAGEIQAWHQAKVDMRSGAIVGSEALVRWNHPVRGMLLPGSFIPLFERNGLVTLIDFFIFEQTCRSLHSWKLRNLPLHTVSCNFSRLHFDQPDFPQRLAAVAERYGVPRHLLEVEITESAIMKNPEAAWMQIIQLKEMGFKTAIDDFGSGYSSLGIVQMLSADSLKIDRSFIQRDLPGQRAQIVLSNIIRLASDLGMDVICEGVENAEQAGIIKRLGCYMAQGFFYAKPEPTHEFEARLAMQVA